MKSPSSEKIRVEIDDFEELHTVDELKKPIKIGGVEWTFGVFSETSPRTSHVRHLGFVVHCQKGMRSNLWKVVATCQFKLCKSGAPILGSVSEKIRVEFTPNEKKFEIPDFMNWQEATSQENGYVCDNTAVVEVEIHVESVEGLFDGMSNMLRFEKMDTEVFDAELSAMDGEPILVAKKVLAFQSEYFEELFSNNPEVDDPKKVPVYTIDDVTHDELFSFTDLMYDCNLEWICDETIDSTLKLADRFKTSLIMQKCEQFVIGASHLDIVDKLKYAETYKLSALQSHCLSQLKTTEQVLELAKNNKYKELGAITSEALFQRISEISKENAEKIVEEKEVEVVEEENTAIEKEEEGETEA